MGAFIIAGNRADFPPGTMRFVNLEGTPVLMANIEGNYYALNDKCPHMGGSLSKGTLSGNVVTCPLHLSQFDVTTGNNLSWLKGAGALSAMGRLLKAPRDAIKYNVKIDGSQILVEI